MNESLRARKIGITGGIGVGKSYVRRILAKHGFSTADADQYVHQAVLIPETQAKIISVFGAEAFTSDGLYNRSYMRNLVFENAPLKKRLESILFPATQDLCDQAFAWLQFNSPGAWFFYEASLLIEAGRSQEFDAIVLVTAPIDVRIKRVMLRSALSPEDVQKIIEQQSSDDYRRGFCNFEIANSGEPQLVEQKTRELLNDLYNHFCPTHS